MQHKKYFIFLITLLCFSLFQYVTLSPSKTDLEVYFLDVGQGDAILISFPTGERMLIDTGKDSKVFRELDKVLPWYEKTIDYVMLTHGDLDHVGAMSDLWNRYRVKTLFVHEFFGAIDVEKQIISDATQYGASVHTLTAGDSITIGASVPTRLDILHPDPTCNTVHLNDNDCSLVGLLTYGEHTFLFTGDIDSEVEEIIDDRIEGHITVLKVGHHGSKNSTSEAFVQDVRPAYSVIQSGENSYGHPHPDAIANLASVSSTIFNTKEDATIVASSRGIGEIRVEPLFDKSGFFESSVCAILLYGFDTSC